MTDSIDLIRRRALKFAATLDFVDPVIVDVRPADDTVVSERGSGDASQYRTVRIELQMSPDSRQRMIELATPKDADDLKRFLEGPWTFDVTCNATDVILSDTPYID